LNKPEQPTRFFSIGTPLPGENPTYPTANIFYRRSAFRELGGFDDSVWIGNLVMEFSDTDLAWRAIERDYSHSFVEDMAVYHEISQVSPLKWILINMRLIHFPGLVHQHPGLRGRLFWWGPFALLENFLFYAAILGLILAVAGHPIFLLLGTPFLYRAARVPGRGLTFKGLALIPARIFFLILRQMAICGFLLYGSLRARTLVL